MADKIKSLIATKNQYIFRIVGEYFDYDIIFDGNEFSEDDIIYAYNFILFSKNISKIHSITYTKPGYEKIPYGEIAMICIRRFVECDEECQYLSADKIMLYIYKVGETIYILNNVKFDEIIDDLCEVKFIDVYLVDESYDEEIPGDNEYCSEDDDY